MIRSDMRGKRKKERVKNQETISSSQFLVSRLKKPQKILR